MTILCTIDLLTREVSLPGDQCIAAYDHNVDVIRFQAEPIEDFSLDTSSIKIAAQGPNKARHDYSVDPSTVQIEEETGYITFDWPIPQGVTEMPIGTFKYGDRGQLIFAVCAEIISGSTVSRAWHSDDGIITVVAHLEPEAGGGEDPSETATNAQKIGQLQTDVAVIRTEVGALANGSPTPVATVAEMTDESAVYLYTGSETGYTAGNWYYYNGSAWTSGGTYGGATTSTTFNQHGVPADDFAVGEALADKADSDDVTALDTRVTAVEADLSDIAVEYTPINYGTVSVENLVIGSSGLSGKVTATNTTNGVSLINTAGVNGTVGFELANLPYGSNKALDFTVEISGAVTPINLDIRRGVSSGSVGVVVASLALTDGVYALNKWIIANYNHDTYGDLYLGYSLRYNQTSAVTISLSIKEHGDTEKITIKNNALVDVGYNNLSPSLKNAITLVSGTSPTEYGGKQICTFNKGLAIGDSLTSGVFNYTGGGTTIPAFSFPAKIGQLTGINMTNLGNGGKTSVEWYTLHSADDLSGYQFAIIQLGVNDAMQYNGWTQNSIDAFTSIIDKLLSENNGIFVFVSTIIPATSYTGASYNAVSEGIRNLVATLNNNHVILLDMAQYAHTGDAVGYNNGHLSALGYERLALDYISYISYVISQNLTLFRNIQFIGTNYFYP